MTTSAAPSVNVQEAARRARVDERTIRRWISSGRLRAARGRGGWRIAAAALAPLLEVGADPPDGARADSAGDTDGVPEVPEAPPTVSALDVALAEVTFLRGQVEALQERLRETHVLLAQRPALPAPSTTCATVAQVSRPWWARWLGWRR
jgi:excisionase family DNA binding protein